MGKPTSPGVAYIEAFDHFAGRYAEFIRQVVQGGDPSPTPGTSLLQPQTISRQIQQDFLAQELSSNPVRETAVATLGARGEAIPASNLRGGSDEGSVYGCIFIDFARRVGLQAAVNVYLQSAASGVLTFGEYKTWISNNRPADLADLEAAQRAWDL